MKAGLKIDELKEMCRRGGLKLTPQRWEIYSQLAADKGHPSAEVIYRRVREKMPTISLDTVYRTLASLEKIGAAARVEASEDKARFDADMTPHNHLICTVCKSISDFSWPEFEALEPPGIIDDWGRVSDKNAVLRGVCNACRKSGEH